MIITGWQKTSLIDYPGKIAAIFFTPGCQFRCRFCYNPELVEPELFPPKIEEDKIFNYLKKRKKVLDGVVITGGEPTLQPELIDFLKKVSALDFLVKLDTNGLKPEVLEEVIRNKLADYLAMDIKAPLNRYEEITRVKLDPQKIKKSLKLIEESGLSYEFRSTLVPGFHNKEDVLAMAKLIKGASKYYLQNFTLAAKDKILDPLWAKKESFKAEEMEEFRKVASKWIENCEVR